MFLGRKKEINILEMKYNSNKKEFGVIYGRRRIGKSSILTNFLKDKNCIFFQAKKDNAFGNLKSFSYELNKKYDLPLSFVYSSWEEALDTIIQKEKNTKIILAIDEYPYIVAQDGSYPSILQNFIDKAPDNIFLILSGSDISFLKDEILSHSAPLYKRITFSMEVKKMDFEEACLFLDGLNNDDKSKYLSLFGSYPYYLSAINKSKTFDENVKDLIFNEYAPFFNLPDQLLSNSTKIQDVYNSILLSIATKHTSIKDISDDIHEEQAKVAKYINTLLSSEIIERLEMFQGNKKNNYYAIKDSLLKFWYVFIFNNMERIKINNEIVFNCCKEKIHLFISHEFENVCHLYMELLNKKGLLNDLYPMPKNYKVEKSKLNRSIEIDGLAQNNNNLLVIDCKYRNCLYTNKMYNHLKESVSVFPDKLTKYYYIFSKNGFESTFVKEKNVYLYTLDQMFEKIN